MRAYRRGAADYAAALLRKDAHGKRIVRRQNRTKLRTKIARYVYPGRGDGGAATGRGRALISSTAGAARCRPISSGRCAWYKAQGLIDKDVDARDVVDPSFVK